jgi:pimeloyl-ACP methyl ester carboxylesterase
VRSELSSAPGAWRPAPVRWQALDVPAGGLRLHVHRVAEPAAPAIILLHGLGVSGTVWQAFARRLAPRFAAVAPDLRGHGESDAPPTGYRPEDYARDLAAMLEALGIGQAPVLGHSLGSLVALALADRRPDLVSGLVLVDPPVDSERRNPDVSNVFRLRHEPPGRLEEYLLTRNPGGGRPLAEMLARLFRRAADAAFTEMLTAPPGHPEAWESARHVRHPTLVVQADPSNDGVLGDVAAQSFTECLARGQLLKVPGAAHAVHASHPRELAAAATRFLTGASVGNT